MADNYIFCIPCQEFVLEFCSLHGTPLIIPDSKLALSSSLPRIPRAALTIPHAFLHLAPSNATGNGVGVFSSVQLVSGIRFGPYRGVYSDTTSSMHCWLVYNPNKSYVIDGSDTNNSNWMRYVKCSRHFSEQNLIAYQQNGHIYYCTIKPIPPYTELLVYYGTEFAYLLNIDFRKYNKPESFIENMYTTDINNVAINNKDKTYLEPKCHQNGIQNLCTGSTNQYILEETDHYVQKPDSTKDKFSCDICERKFNLKYSLTRHKRSHLSIKRFKCTYCNYESNENYALTTHINATHTKEMAYTCNICSKVFYHKKSYNKHQKLHLKHKY